jgi:hypothetical protein
VENTSIEYGKYFGSEDIPADCEVDQVAHGFHPVKWEFWERVLAITVEEAALLTCGVDPYSYETELEESLPDDNFGLPSDIQAKHDEYLDLLNRAIASNAIPHTASQNHAGTNLISMEAWKEWCRKNSFDLPVKTTKEQPSSSASTKVINTLQKIIIGMAMDGYGYDPQDNKSELTGEGPNSLHSILAGQNIDVSSDAIRKHISAAKKLIE